MSCIKEQSLFSNKIVGLVNTTYVFSVKNVWIYSKKSTIKNKIQLDKNYDGLTE